MSADYSILSLLLIASALPFDPAIADTLDVFPIYEGVQYTYAYRDSVSGTGHFGDFSYTESGTVSYRIFHAVPLDDWGIHWEMMQYRNMTRIDYPWETITTILDTQYCLLQETTTGLHALYGGSYLWKFPVHLGTFMPEITDTIFRYSEQSPSILRFESQCDSTRTYFDSLWFRVDSGLTQWRWENCFEDIFLRGEAYGSAQLVSIVVTAIEEQGLFPLKTRLMSNYPNPFNGQTTISYDLGRSGPVVLTIYDLMGRLITSIDEGYQNPGNHSIAFYDPGISSGIYLVRLQTIEGVQTGRMVYLR